MTSLKFNSEIVDGLVKNGKYNEALELIIKIETNKNLENEEINQVNLLKSQIYNYLTLYSKSLQYSQDLLVKSKEEQNYFYYFRAITYRIEALDALNKLDSCAELILEANNLINQKNLDFIPELNIPLAKYYNRIGIYLQKSYKYDEALKAFQKSHDFYDILNDSLGKADILTNMGLTHGLMKSFGKAMDFFNRSLKISRQYGKNMITAWTLAHKSQLSYQISKDKTIINDLNEVFEICSALNNIHCKDYAYNILGNYSFEKGNYHDALKYQQMSYELRKKRDNKLEMAYTLCSIAGIYSRRGDIKKANHYIQKIFLIQEKFSDSLANTLFLSIKGEILTEQGNFKEGSLYLEEALEKFDKLNDFNQRYRTIHFLIWIAITKVDKDKQYQLLDYIQNLIRKFPHNKNLKFFYKLEQGIVFKNSRDTYKELVAKKIFGELAEEEVTQIWIIIEAMLNNIEILLGEIKHSRKKILINDIDTQSSNLLDIAEKQIFIAVISETLLLKANIAIFNNKLEQARILFTKAQYYAHEKGLDLLAQKISDEHDRFLIQSNMEDKDRQTSLDSKITNFEFVFSKITRNFRFQVSYSPYNPLFLIIKKKNNDKIYTIFPLKDQGLNKQNCPNYMEIFEESEKSDFLHNNSFDRINIKNFLVIKGNRGDIRCFFGFHGNSYNAKKELDKFLDKIQNLEEAWNDLKNEKVNSVSEQSKSVIDGYINEIFSD